MSAESDFPPAAHEPTRELLLAQALEACIQAERQVPGSADQVIAHQPAWARAELRRLVALAGSLDAVATSAVMSEEFRVAARARLMRRIATQPTHEAPVPKVAEKNGHAPVSPGLLRSVTPADASAARNGHQPVRRRRRTGWLWRGGAGGLLAAALVLGATLTASASALPGEPLYSVKQAREAIGYRFAPDDQARTLVLLGQADARLDETARLLQLGRTQYVAETTQRFDDVLDRATTTYVVTIAEAPRSDPTTQTLENKLNAQQQEIQTLLAMAPDATQADLREALVATQRGRALVADRHSSGPTATPEDPPVAAPTAAEMPTPGQTAAARVVAPPPVDLVPQKPAEPTAVVAVQQHDTHEIGVEHALGGAAGAVTHSGSGPSALNGRSSSAHRGDDHLDSAQVPTADMSSGEGDADARGDGQGQRAQPRAQGTRVVVVPRPTGASVVAHQDAVQHDDGEADTGQRGDGRGDGPADGQAQVQAQGQAQSQGQSQVQAQGQGPDRVAQQANSTAPTSVVARQASTNSSGTNNNNFDSHGGGGGGDARTWASPTPGVAVAQPANVITRSANTNFTGSGNTNRQQSPTPTPASSTTLRAQASPAPTNADARRSGGDGNTSASRVSSQSGGSDRSGGGVGGDGGRGGH